MEIVYASPSDDPRSAEAQYAILILSVMIHH